MGEFRLYVTVGVVFAIAVYGNVARMKAYKE